MSININTTRRLISREAFLGIFTISFGAIAGLVIAVPIIGYVLAPLIKQPGERWQDVQFAAGQSGKGLVKVDSIPLGQTEKVVFQALDPMQWAGTTANQGAWLRRTGPNSFLAYSIYCPHLGCPVKWLPDAEIFLCPCHGSVFNADGTVAGGPAPRALFHYNVRVQNGRVQIQTHPLPIAS